ncbi:hypothetical protein [Paracidovorax konjaci]|uniref:Uncharacterized protein n=1 Tax=Paracidovorax konjaci TaxID=32040 RepID=A0A1I1V767_9BURK|nr:hypothetical protein [Paracidovorax konjaci]SFD78764.1 hypothetical protein SAMN04489710_10694 [Paracidovorax konjaci]
MSTMVTGYSASISIRVGIARTGTTAGNAAAQTRQASAALEKHMQQRGIDALTPNLLSQLARNASGDTPDGVSEAAAFLLRNPDIYALLETHDVAGRDGITGASNLGFAARGGYDALLQDALPSTAQAAVTEQEAAGAIAAFRQQHPSAQIDANTLYRLAMRPNGDTSPAASAAARFLLQNPEALDRIAAKNAGSGAADAPPQGPAQGATALPGQDRVAPVQARPGRGSGDTAQTLDAQSAARILADHMLHGKPKALAGLFGTQAMTVDRLHRLAEGGKASPEVAAAARFMLQNPDIYRAIETHDVPGADGKSGVGNLLAAARGDIPGVGGKASGAANSVLQLLLQLLRALNGTASAAGAVHTPAAQPLDAQSASRILADHMVSEAGGARHLFGKRFLPQTAPMTAERLYQLSQGQGPVADAAKFMLQNPDIYRAIETHDVPGADGKSGLGNLLAAARGEVPGAGGGVQGRLGDLLQQLQLLLQLLQSFSQAAQPASQKQPLDAQSAARTLADHMVAEGGGVKNLFGKHFLPRTRPMTIERLQQLSQGQGPVADAAKFMLQNPDIYRAIETHDVRGADGKSGLGNLLAAARGEVPGVSGQAGQLLQQLQQLLQVLRALMPQVQGTAGTQAPLDGQSAARVLADHLLAQAGPPRRLLGRQLIDASKVETLTPDRLYQLSQGQGPVANAAKFMLQNPDIYRAIDTHDVPGADGESSIGNLLAAANGKVPGVQGGAASRLAGTSRSVQDVLQQILPVLPGSNGAQTTAMARALDGQSAARTLADHMLKISASELARVFEPGDMSPDRLYKLAESGTAPPEVEAAAKFMMQNPDIYRAIETHDAPGADGRSAVGNLLAAARGEVPGVNGPALAAGGTPGTNGTSGTGGATTVQGGNPLAAIRELLGRALEGLQTREQHRVAQIEIQISIRTQVTVVA